jgi:arabinogalactan oligomer/maltooligosaccharide transport system substrate-binding protein
MINNKKALAMGLGALASLALCACGSTGTASSSAATSKANSSTATSSAATSSTAASSATTSQGGDTGDADLSIWCPSTDNDITTQIITDFKAANTGYASKSIKVIANYGEGDVYGAMSKDITASADVVCMADDNIRSAVDGELLVSLTDAEKAALVTTEGEANVNSASIDGVCYGYPYRADNSYMLFYDSSIVSDTQAQTLEGIIAACKASSAKFSFPISNSWYGASPLWAAGGTETVNEDTILVSNFGTEAVAKGGQAWADLYASNVDTWTSTDSKDTILAGFTAGATTKFGAAVLWNAYNDFHAANENVKVTKLPTMVIDGAAKQMKAFVGTKEVVLANKTDMTGDKLALAKAFASYYTNKASQKARISLGYGPSNLELGASDDVASLPFVKAIGQQAAIGATVSQAGQTTSKYWTPVETWGKLIINNAPNWGDYGDGIDGCLDSLKALVKSDGWKAAA